MRAARGGGSGSDSASATGHAPGASGAGGFYATLPEAPAAPEAKARPAGPVCTRAPHHLPPLLPVPFVRPASEDMPGARLLRSRGRDFDEIEGTRAALPPFGHASSPGSAESRRAESRRADPPRKTPRNLLPENLPETCRRVLPGAGGLRRRPAATERQRTASQRARPARRPPARRGRQVLGARVGVGGGGASRRARPSQSLSIQAAIPARHGDRDGRKPATRACKNRPGLVKSGPAL